MALPRFSEMLIARTRQLGLSISQASKVLKLKEQALQRIQRTLPYRAAKGVKDFLFKK